MSEETKPAKGRKFIALQEGMIFGILYMVACMINEKLVELAMFAMAVVGLVATYIGANAVKGIKK